MTKHDLKELAAMGAELGAAKAEVERLREALRPFAVFEAVRSKQGGCTPKSGTVWAVSSAGEETEITVEHLQASVSALSQQAEPQQSREAEGLLPEWWLGTAPAIRDVDDCGPLVPSLTVSDEAEPRFELGNVESPYDVAVNHFADVGFSRARYSYVVSDGGMDPRNAPAPAQDERNPTSADYLAARSALESCDWSNVPIGTKAILGRAVDLLWLAAQARPAQTEQQPVAMQPDCDAVAVCGCRIVQSRKLGNVIILCAAHITQTEQRPIGRVFTDEERFRSDGKSGPVWWFGPLPAGAMLYAAPIAQTAPQPEQSGLVEMIDAAMIEMRNIAPPLRRSDCERLIRAALSAQGAGDADS